MPLAETGSRFGRRRAHHPEPGWPVGRCCPGKTPHPVWSPYPTYKKGFLRPHLLRRPETAGPLCKASDACSGFPVTHGFVPGVSGRRAAASLEDQRSQHKEGSTETCGPRGPPQAPQVPMRGGWPRASGAGEAEGRVGRGVGDSCPHTPSSPPAPAC